MSDLMEMIEPYLKEEGVDRDALIGSLTNYVEKEKNGAIEPLAANKQEILNEKRELNEKFKALNESVSWLNSLDDPLTHEKYNDMLSEMATLKEGMNKSEEDLADKLNKRYEAGKDNASQLFQPKLDSLTERLKLAESARDDYKQKFQDFQVQNKINEAFQKIGATPDENWRDGFMLHAKSTFGDNGLEGISVRHNGMQIPLEEWMNVFPNTPEGKKLILAPVNVGGGAKGGDGKGGSGPKTLEDIEKIKDPVVRRAELKKLYGRK